MDFGNTADRALIAVGRRRHAHRGVNQDLGYGHQLPDRHLHQRHNERQAYPTEIDYTGNSQHWPDPLQLRSVHLCYARGHRSHISGGLAAADDGASDARQDVSMAPTSSATTSSLTISRRPAPNITSWRPSSCATTQVRPVSRQRTSPWQGTRDSVAFHRDELRPARIKAHTRRVRRRRHDIGLRLQLGNLPRRRHVRRYGVHYHRRRARRRHRMFRNLHLCGLQR